MLENKLFEALLDVVPFRAYAVDIDSYEIVYANKPMRENMYAPKESYCWEKIYGQEQICSWCSIITLKQRTKSEKKATYVSEFFDESDDKWIKAYDELMTWPDGREVKYSILVDITDQKEIQGEMVKSHAKLAMQAKQLKSTNQNLQITKLKLQKSVNETEYARKKAETALKLSSKEISNLFSLMRETKLDIEQKEYVEKIELASSSLIKIINDILELSLKEE